MTTFLPILEYGESEEENTANDFVSSTNQSPKEKQVVKLKFPSEECLGNDLVSKILSRTADTVPKAGKQNIKDSGPGIPPGNLPPREVPLKSTTEPKSTIEPKTTTELKSTTEPKSTTTPSEDKANSKSKHNAKLKQGAPKKVPTKVQKSKEEKEREDEEERFRLRARDAAASAARKAHAQYTLVERFIEQGCASEEELHRLVIGRFTTTEFQEVSEELYLAGLCGNPLCRNPAPKHQAPKSRYRISLREHKVYEVPQTPRMMCGPDCTQVLERLNKHMQDLAAGTVDATARVKSEGLVGVATKSPSPWGPGALGPNGEVVMQGAIRENPTQLPFPSPSSVTDPSASNATPDSHPGSTPHSDSEPASVLKSNSVEGYVPRDRSSTSKPGNSTAVLALRNASKISEKLGGKSLDGNNKNGDTSSQGQVQTTTSNAKEDSVDTSAQVNKPTKAINREEVGQAEEKVSLEDHSVRVDETRSVNNDCNDDDGNQVTGKHETATDIPSQKEIKAKQKRKTSVTFNTHVEIFGDQDPAKHQPATAPATIAQTSVSTSRLSEPNNNNCVNSISNSNPLPVIAASPDTKPDSSTSSSSAVVLQTSAPSGMNAVPPPPSHPSLEGTSHPGLAGTAAEMPLLRFDILGLSRDELQACQEGEGPELSGMKGELTLFAEESEEVQQTRPARVEEALTGVHPLQYQVKEKAQTSGSHAEVQAFTDKDQRRSSDNWRDDHRKEDGEETGDESDVLSFDDDESDCDSEDEVDLFDDDATGEDSEHLNLRESKKSTSKGAVPSKTKSKSPPVVLSGMGQLLNLLMAWATPATGAFLHDRPFDSKQEAYGVESPEAVAVSSSQQRTALAASLSLVLPTLIHRLHLRLPVQVVENHLAELVTTFQIRGSVPHLSSGQWKLIVLVFLTALMEHRMPNLKSHSKDMQSLAQQIELPSATSLTEQEFACLVQMLLDPVT